MEIRNVHYDATTQAYLAQVCVPHAGRMITLPARVTTTKPLRPSLLSDILAHRATRQLPPQD